MAADATPCEVARRIGLDAEVDRSDGKPLWPIGFDDAGGLGADFDREVGAEHRWLAADPVEQLVRIGQLLSGIHASLHRAEAAQTSHYGICMNARNPGGLVVDQ